MYHHPKDESIGDEVLKTLTKTLTFVDDDANAAANAKASAISSLCKYC